MSEAGPTSISSLGLILRNLRYYWLTNLAVIAAVIAGTAVIGGALVVGDSVR
jgi:putative ABC transport system permease protein